MFTLSETNIVTTDLSQAREFYVNVLGFEEIEEDSGALRLRKNGAYFLLLPVARESNPANSGVAYSVRAQISFDLSTTDLAKAHAYLREQNCRVEPDVLSEDTQFVVAFDHDGNAIEIVPA